MVEIRAFSSEDYSSVKRILEETLLYDADLDTKSNLTRKIQDSPESVLVAEEKGTVIGVVYTIFDWWNSFIYRLAVDKKYQRKGVGSLLLAAAEHSLKAKGATEVALWIKEAEIPNLLGYYKKHGYSASPRKHQCMWKKL